MEGPPLLLFYLLVKYVVYATWCWLGVRSFSSKSSAFFAGLGFGLLRLLMGFLFGLVILYLVNQFKAPNETFILYLVVYVPVRLIEWLIMVVFISGLSSVLKTTPSQWGSRALWVLGGIVISCLADIPVFYAIGGYPIGRFMC